MANEPTPDQGAQALERRLATILCADVAGYSRMMGEDEERTVRVFRGHREIFESLVRQHRGRIFNTAGDALLAEFTSAVEAVRCATDIQAALRTRNEHLAPEERMLFRMGINLGDVIVQGGDLLGDGVNVAARIQAATEPGGICISGSVHDQIQNKLSLGFRLLGEQTYKNIARPVRTYSIIEGAARPGYARRPSARMVAPVAAAALLLVGAGYWGYRQFERQRAELARTGTRLAAELAAQKQATEQARGAAEDAKREAALQAERQAAEEGLRRAQEERTRVEQERKLLDTEKRLAETVKRQGDISPRGAAPATAPVPATAPTTATSPAPTTGPVPATAFAPTRGPAATTSPPLAPSSVRYDGTYNGQLCNHPKNAPKPNCWQVTLTVRNGVAEGSWLSRTRNQSTARGTIAANGVLDLKLAGWTPERDPTEAALIGRVTDDAMTASGRWRGGLSVSGEWTRQQAPPAAPGTPASAARYDGTYVGRLCNQPRDKTPSCWPVDLVVRDGIAEAEWPSRSKNTSRATGNLAADGSLTLKVSGWTAEGNPTEAALSGRVVDDAIAASGQWHSGLRLEGDWKRAR
jgi:class 3 adenylate cyclase